MNGVTIDNIVHCANVIICHDFNEDDDEMVHSFYFRYIIVYIYYINTKTIDSVQLLTLNMCFLHSVFQKPSRLVMICECQEWKHFA